MSPHPVPLLPALVGLLLAPAFQSKPPAAPPPQNAPPAAPAAPAAKVERVAPTFQNLHVDAAELPAGFTLAKEPAFVSVQAETLVVGPLSESLAPMLPELKRKDFQTVVAKEGRGSVAYLEFGSTSVPDDAIEFVGPLLWGGEGPSRQHPEQMVRAGNVLVIVSFKPGDPAGEWTIDRLRHRFGLRLRFDWGDLRGQLSAVMRAYNQKDTATGLKLLRGEAAKLGARSMGAYLEGELCNATQDWAGGEKAYARALELDATTDPLPDEGIYFATADGRGMSLWGLKRYEEGAKVLREAAKLAAALKRPADQGQSLYNAACCLALLGKGDDAMVALAESLKLSAPELKEHAKTDTDLDSLRSRDDFKKLFE